MSTKTFSILIAFGCLMHLLLLLPSAIAQNNNDGNNLLQQFDQYRRSHYQEKLYLHLDKNFYVAGEIAWFKVYTTDAYSYRPSDLSSVAYVEWLDSNNKSVLQAKIPLTEGRGSGSFYLPSTLATGPYRIAAYTSWMKNFAAENFFYKDVSVINAQVDIDTTTAERNANKNQATLQFFPEGGQLVRSLPSRVAYKLIGHSTDLSAGKAIVQDSEGNTVTSFDIAGSGIGVFDFTPQQSAKYNATIVLNNGKTFISPLPPVMPDGFVLKAEQLDEAWQIKVLASSGAANSSGRIRMLVHTRESNVSLQEGKLQQGQASFVLPKKTVGEGLSHITIFSEEGQPLCERLIFKPVVSQIVFLKTATDNTVYDTRSKISLQMNAADHMNKPVAGNYSLSVYRVDSLQSFDSEGINSYMWLHSELGQNVALQAGQWITDTTRQGKQKLDELLMVYGWRRFSWQDVLSGQPPVFQYPPEPDGHMVTGDVRHIESGQRTAGIDCYMTVPSKYSWMRVAKSDKNGQIKFNVKRFYGEPSSIIVTGQDDTLYSVVLHDPFANNHTAGSHRSGSMPFATPLWHILSERNIGAQTQQIYFPLQQRQYFPPPDTLPFYGKAEFQYRLDNYTRFTTLEEVFREYIMPVAVRIRPGNKYELLTAVEQMSNYVEMRASLVLVNGLPVNDHNKVMRYDPLLFNNIDVVNRRYFYGSKLFFGIISLSTYSGDFSNIELDPKAAVVDYAALQQQRIYYSPDYDTEAKKASRLPDFRNQLQWIPDVTIDATGSHQIHFYSSDLPGRYAAVLQGLTPDGKTGESVTYFEVRQ